MGGTGNTAGGLRYGIGIELRPGGGRWGITFQGMWERFGDAFGYQNFENESWTLGVSYRL